MSALSDRAGPPRPGGRVERRQLAGPLVLALAGHGLLLAGLSLGHAPRLGDLRVHAVETRMIDGPVHTRVGITAPAPTPVPPAVEATDVAQPAPRAEAKAKPTPRGEARLRSDQPATDTSGAPAAAAPLPDGQDPLLMLPTTPEQLRLFDELSLVVAADPALYAVGNAVSVTIEDQGKTRTWRFVVAEEDSIQSLRGRAVPTLRLVHFPEFDADEKIELWLVPELAYRPIQVAITDALGSSRITTARVALNLLDSAPSKSTAAWPDAARPRPPGAGAR